jgi:hypothetical protein
LAIPHRTDTPRWQRLTPSVDTINGYSERVRKVRTHHRPTPFEPLTESALSAATTTLAPPPPWTSIQGETTGLAKASLIANVELPDTATSGTTSPINEPNVAVRGKEILYTGNWYASYSLDGGATFNYLNPYTTFPPPANEQFCCDQLALYVPAFDMMVWLLQYGHPTTQGPNRQRLAVAVGADIAGLQFRYYDFTPEAVGGWTGEWFDFPAMATSDNFLYLTSNAFTFEPGATFTRSVAMRLPLRELAAYAPLPYSVFSSTEFGSLRPTQGARSVMYLGAQRVPGQLRVFEWPESASELFLRDVLVEPFAVDNRAAPGPDGRDWLARVDPRILAGWLNSGQIGFAWTAGRDARFPQPHVRVAIIDPTTWIATAQPHIWNNEVAFAYPAAAPNASGLIGVSVAFGGGPLQPGHAVGIGDLAAPDVWSLVATDIGTHGPSVSVWGDYFSVAPHGTLPDSWVASGFTQIGGPEGSDVVPRYVHFGTAAVSQSATATRSN